MWEARDEVCDCKSSAGLPRGNVLHSGTISKLVSHALPVTVLDLTLRSWLCQFGTRLLACDDFDRFFF